MAPGKNRSTKIKIFSNTMKVILINSDYYEEPTRQSLDGSYSFEDPRPLPHGKKKTTRNKSLWNTVKLTLINFDYCKDLDAPIINMIV